jgi:uncharacterized protein YdeI (BOF family)
MEVSMKWTSIIATALISFSAFAGFSDKTNGEWVTLSGKVSGVTARTFDLNVDGKKIPVEMDDYGWGADGYKLINGDQVVVSGRVDKDFLEKKKVEAGSVYVKSLNSYFFANSADEKDLLYIPTTYSYYSTLPEGASVDVQGKVTSVNGREFTVDTGFRKVTVDTKSLLYNPLDKVGFTKIKKGDRVRVSGKVQDDLFDTKEVSANFVMNLL